MRGRSQRDRDRAFLGIGGHIDRGAIDDARSPCAPAHGAPLPPRGRNRARTRRSRGSEPRRGRRSPRRSQPRPPRPRARGVPDTRSSCRRRSRRAATARAAAAGTERARCRSPGPERQPDHAQSASPSGPLRYGSTISPWRAVTCMPSPQPPTNGKREGRHDVGRPRASRDGTARSRRRSTARGSVDASRPRAVSSACGSVDRGGLGLARVGRFDVRPGSLAGGRRDRELGVDDRPRVRDEERAGDEDEHAERQCLDAADLASIVDARSPHRSASRRTTTVRSIVPPPNIRTNPGR